MKLSPLCLALVATTALAQAAAQQTETGGRPNILVIMSDQHSRSFLGCYGNRIVRTPNLDRLAAEGMRFTAAYCAAPVCVPSRMSFLTSRTPSANRVWHNESILSSGIPTWPHALSIAGYETSLIGRMHFDGPDQRHGFENRPIGEYLAGHPGSGQLPGRVLYHGGSGQSRSAVEAAGRGRTTYQHFDELVTEKAVAYLRERARSQRPFAVVVGLVLPHCPFIGPKELFDYYLPHVDLPEAEARQPASIIRFRRQRGILDPLTEAQVRVARAAYYALCERLDKSIGQLLTCLDETGLSRNTLVIYTSDHGEMAGEHGCWCKSNYYEESVGVPLIVRLPGRIAPGAVSDAVCNLMDLGPTFAEVAGATMPGSHGRSLWPTLTGRHPGDWLQETVSELFEASDKSASRMIRSGKWKLWVHFDEENLPPSLFNLEDDPRERNDLGQDPRHAEVRDRLLRKLLEGWDPQQVIREAEQARQDYSQIVRWGKAVSPPCPDAVPVPPPSFEDDVELFLSPKPTKPKPK